MTMTGHVDILSILRDERLSEIQVSSPFVSVIVTNFNYARFLGSCLESIARQTYRNFKCVIVDDCSTDNSIDIVNTFIKSPLADERFTLICHSNNLGQMGAFRTGLLNAEGPFLVYVDADDLLLEDFLEAHLQAHFGHEPVAFTSSNQYQINEIGELIAGTHSDHKSKGECRYVLSKPLHNPYWVWATTSSMMFRRSVLDLVMPDEDDNYKICADNYICHFANIVGNSLLIPTIHGCYRRHGNNHFSSNEMVGGSHPTGDMELHPKDHIIRLNIFLMLCKRHELFAKILSKGGLAKRLASTSGPFEILKFRKMLPKNTFLVYLLCYALLLRLSQLVKLMGALDQKKQLAFNYGTRASILKIPGH